MEGIINKAIADNPQSEHILTAFKPLFLARESLANELVVRPVDPSSIDRERLSRGIPCIRQAAFFFEDDPWERAGLEAASAIKEGFPVLVDDAVKLGAMIRSGEIRIFDAYEDFPGSIDAVMAQFSDRAGIKPQAAGLLLGCVTRVMLEAKAKAIGERLRGAGWDKGYCPVCGAHPTIAIIREKITQRWLHCSQCGCEWRFSRMVCPGCGQENPGGLDYFYLEGRDQETAFTCDSCKRYLITLNHISDIGDQDRDVTAMSLVHLDLIMQEKGFAPMTWCVWNVFYPPGKSQHLC
jgi:FdhE protein